MAVTAVSDINAQRALFDHLHSSGQVERDSGAAFDNLLSSAINMYKETDDLQNAAEESEINFALGYATSTHELADAQQRANLSLQYTIKVTSKAIEAYKELMNMQI